MGPPQRDAVDKRHPDHTADKSYQKPRQTQSADQVQNRLHPCDLIPGTEKGGWATHRVDLYLYQWGDVLSLTLSSILASDE